MSAPLFQGCATALVTPFRRDGAIDQEALIRLIEIHRAANMDAIVLLGTTGEPCTLTMAERETVITTGIKAAGSIPVIVGTGSNDTRKAIEYARQAAALGAAGQLCVTPYYNKATQSGLIAHFSAIADCSRLPMILYNVPSRTGIGLLPETLKKLASHPGIIGLKEASSDLSLAAAMFEATNNALPIYAGNDDAILPLMAMGASGAISVVSNLLPSRTKSLTDDCLNGRFVQAQSSQQALLPLIRALFSQVNPIPVKAALSSMNLIEDVLRLPLTPMEEPHRARLMDTLRAMKLLAEHS